MKILFQTESCNQVLSINENWDLEITQNYSVGNQPAKIFSKEKMQEFAKSAKGINRIHKPIALLFWIDCKNGKFSNWTK